MGVCENCQLALDELEARTEELEQKRVRLRARKSALQELTVRMAEKGEPASATLAAMMEEENMEVEETEALCSGYRFGAIYNFKCPHNDDHLSLSVMGHEFPVVKPARQRRMTQSMGHPVPVRCISR
ncbi:hypothetical protein PG996_009238 [Apiospora saccharicola]|uniref:Uncharacterized protein n=1 Tax=Apiospora saccharicola TaxID=335842 RepID=A0ABR1UK69_9PEZI